MHFFLVDFILSNNIPFKTIYFRFNTDISESGNKKTEAVHAPPLSTNQIKSLNMKNYSLSCCLIHHHFSRRRGIAAGQSQKIHAFGEREGIALFNRPLHDFLAKYVHDSQQACTFHGEAAFGGVGIDAHRSAYRFGGR